MHLHRAGGLGALREVAVEEEVYHLLGNDGVDGLVREPRVEVGHLDDVEKLQPPHGLDLGEQLDHGDLDLLRVVVDEVLEEGEEGLEDTVATAVLENGRKGSNSSGPDEGAGGVASLLGDEEVEQTGGWEGGMGWG
jgi:hypothetical protein